MLRYISKKKIKTALNILRESGFKGLYNRIKILLVTKRSNRHPTGEFYSINSIPELKHCNFSIAVHIHLFYEDLADEFVHYLNNIPFYFDLFVSCREGVNSLSLENKFRTVHFVKKICIKNVENRGRDILPFYVTFGKELSKYRYIMHAHSKKSLYSGNEQVNWRQNSMNELCGSQELVRKIFYLFEKSNAGLIYPENYENVPSVAYSWLMNEACGRNLLTRMGIPTPQGIFLFPAGSFFWVRTEAITPIFDLNLSREDFPEEAKQNDGTIAHALERVIGIVSRFKGFNDIFVDIRGNAIRKGFSPLPFMQFAVQTEDNAFESLSRYDVISFDIFDTLITRLCYEPDDLFKIMSEKINNTTGKSINFLNIRKEAEALAWQKKQAFTTINDIYDNLPNVSEFTVEESNKLKQMEIELETELVIPRRSMLSLYNRLKKIGKRIILVSDMYLTSDIITQLLEKCGYTGWEAMYVSCEVGLRKDADTIWDKIFNIYDKTHFCHCGDNFRSDGQAVGDRGVAFYPILNAKNAMIISPFRNTFLNQKQSCYTSLLMGFAINAGAFNSPFVISSKNYQLKFEDVESLTYAAFVPLFVHFMQYLSSVPSKNEILLFLAREGYMLMPLYEQWCKIRKINENQHVYFLTSRRAAGVACIENDTDIENLLFQNQYIGSINGLFMQRLGLDLGSKTNNIDTYSLSESERKRILKVVTDNKKIIQETINKEKDNYIEYIRNNYPIENKPIAVIDIGYSGSIQLFLSKLLHTKIGGYYFATLGNKPVKYGCKYNALYPMGCSFTPFITNKQIFFEIALQAPIGQLIKFIKKDDKVIPVYKESQPVIKEITELQLIIQNAVNTFAKISTNLKMSDWENTKVPELIANSFLQEEFFPENMLEKVSAEDGYCRNKTIKFDIINRSWK